MFSKACKNSLINQPGNLSRLEAISGCVSPPWRFSIGYISYYIHCKVDVSKKLRKRYFKRNPTPYQTWKFVELIPSRIVNFALFHTKDEVWRSCNLNFSRYTCKHDYESGIRVSIRVYE